ncbi:hypothetical protein [Hymenobacter sp. UYP22]|uniref:hypothetical protein n=1 Tax=Hymenobacter sp. UYP22 TaxID=3156348 RepID=UPI003399DB65
MESRDNESLIALPDFWHVLDRCVGMIVSDTKVGKPFDKLMLGQEHWVQVHQDNRRWTEEPCFDCEITMVASWKLTKHGRSVSRSNMLFTYSIGPFKHYPSLNSLQQAAVSGITVGPQMELIIRFTNEQQLVIGGLRADKDGKEYPNWLLQIPGTMYVPSAGGNIKAIPYGSIRFK